VKNLIFVMLATFLVSGAAYSAQLDLLRIDSVTQETTANGLEVTVKAWVGCHQDYKGVLLEDVSDRQTLAETKMEIRAVASDRGFQCAGADMLVEDTVTISPFNAGFYTFISVKP